MTTTAFLIEKMDKLVKIYPFLKCRYEINNVTQTHFVEISPAEEEENNESLNLTLGEIIREFDKLFPDVSFTFINKTDYFKVENPLYETQGENYIYLQNVTTNKGIVLNQIALFYSDNNNYALAA